MGREVMAAAVEVAQVAEAQTFSSLLPSFLFIVGGAGSWSRLLVTERVGMGYGRLLSSAVHWRLLSVALVSSAQQTVVLV